MPGRLTEGYFEEDEIPRHYVDVLTAVDVTGYFVDAVSEAGALRHHIIERYVEVIGYRFRFAVIRDIETGQSCFYRFNFSTHLPEKVVLVIASNLNILARGKYVSQVRRFNPSLNNSKTDVRKDDINASKDNRIEEDEDI